MADALNFLQFSLNGLRPVIILTVAFGSALSVSTGMIQLFRNLR